jgi:hypothetical protein
VLVPCDGRLCLFNLRGATVGVGTVEALVACACSDVRIWSGVTISKPGSLVRASEYDELDMSAPAILPSDTGLSRARLRGCEGSGEETLKELDVDRLALTPDRPSETTLSDIAPASLVIANSLPWHERK